VTRFEPSPLHNLVWQELTASRRAIALAILSTLGVALVDLARPWPLKVIFDHVMLGRPAHGLLGDGLALVGSKPYIVVTLTLATVVIAALTGVFAYLQVRVTSRLGHVIVCRLRRELFTHLQRLSLSVHYRARSGEMLTRLAGDTQALRDTFTESAITLGAQVVTITGCFAIMFTLSWQLALIVFATLPLLFWNLFRLYRASRAAARLHRAKEEGLATHIMQALATAPLIRAFGRERYETERFLQRTGEHLAQSIDHARAEAVSARSVELIGAAATAVVVLCGSLEVLAGRMSPGTVLVFSTYLHSLYRPVRQIAKLAGRLSAASVSARRINDVLEITAEPEDPPDAIEAAHVRGDLLFDRVSFGYDPDALVLRDVSFHVKPGERVALVGGSGAGKSTIANLILRLYEPTSGSVRLDGIDIRQYRRESLRGTISMVLQDSLLFGATIRENIAYGKLDASDDEVESAARVANADTFIRRLARGYDTVLGERGATISGGQRQRIAIARAVIRNAPILLLDEPMTGLDRRSQARVQQAIDRVAAARTCLIITHDARTAAAADRVLVLHEGRIVADGRHGELLERSSIYRELFRFAGRARTRDEKVEVCA
jgi:ATP-binding cassette subfamily B protein/subfamily B ATP-binding cassette protein MsbA